MPTYLFEDKDGNRIEKFLSHKEFSEGIYKKGDTRGDYINLDGIELKRVYVPFGSSAVWPKPSMSMGVSPDQIQEAMEADRKHGIHVEYDKRTGDAIHTSMNHRRKHMKLLNMVDRDSFI